MIDTNYLSSIRASLQIPQAVTKNNAGISIETVPSDTTVSSGNVTIGGGRAMMLTRLFKVADPADEPPVEYNPDRPSGLVYDYLTLEARGQVSKMYEYASANGIDLKQVDRLAASYAHYLMRPGASFEGGFSNGQPNYAEFSPEDENKILNVLASKAINDTTIMDHGFLNYVLNAKTWGDIGFVQELVFAFSPSGSDGSANPNAVIPLRPWQKKELVLAELRSQGWDGRTTPAEFASLRDGQQDARERGGVSGLQEGPLGQYASRLNKELVAYLTEEDQGLLGQIYALAEKKGESLGRIDQMAVNLSLLRMQEAMTRSLLDTKPQESEKAGKDGKSETRHANTMQVILNNELARLSE